MVIKNLPPGVNRPDPVQNEAAETNQLHNTSTPISDEVLAEFIARKKSRSEGAGDSPGLAGLKPPAQTSRSTTAPLPQAPPLNALTLPRALGPRQAQARDTLQLLWNTRHLSQNALENNLLHRSFAGPEGGVPPALGEALEARIQGSPDTLGDLLCDREVPLSIRSLNLGSGGDSARGFVAGADNEEVNAFFTSLFSAINDELGHSLDPTDLFHGHLFVCGPDAEGGSGPRAGELGILFHAKAYPRDLHILNPSPVVGDFSTRDLAYRNRNILYLASQNQFFVLTPDPHQAEETRLLQDPLPDTTMHVLMNNGDSRTVAQASYAIDEDLFYALGEKVFDVNLIDGQLFFKP